MPGKSFALICLLKCHLKNGFLENHDCFDKKLIPHVSLPLHLFCQKVLMIV